MLMFSVLRIIGVLRMARLVPCILLVYHVYDLRSPKHKSIYMFGLESRQDPICCREFRKSV
jgi:hypothetical protein